MEVLFNTNTLTDAGCTMKLIKRASLKKIEKKFTVGGSHFSPEFMILAIKAKLKCIEIPVNYRERVGTSKITSNPWKSFKLGLTMIWLIVTYKFKR